jgi:hypothetical protein
MDSPPYQTAASIPTLSNMRGNEQTEKIEVQLLPQVRNKDNFTKLKRKEKKIQLELRSLLSTFLTFARFLFILDFFIIISK